MKIVTSTSFYESTALARVAKLVDTGTFREFCPPWLRRTSPHLARPTAPVAFDDGVVVGSATLADHKILLAAQAGKFNGGAVGEVHGAKLVGLLDRGIRERPAAVLLLVDSGGVRLHEANAGLIAISEIMRAVLRSQAAGVPVVALVVARQLEAPNSAGPALSLGFSRAPPETRQRVSVRSPQEMVIHHAGPLGLADTLHHAPQWRDTLRDLIELLAETGMTVGVYGAIALKVTLPAELAVFSPDAGMPDHESMGKSSPEQGGVLPGGNSTPPAIRVKTPGFWQNLWTRCNFSASKNSLARGLPSREMPTVGPVAHQEAPFLADNFQTIVLLCREALRLEAVVWPKPGLVTLLDSGSHHDMDIDTFHLSIASLKGYFGLVAHAAAKGFTLAALQTIGLPVLRRLLPVLGSREQALIGVLLALMEQSDDTNLLWRGGEEGLAFVRISAHEFNVNGGVEQRAWCDKLVAVHREFVSRSLSPGGSADLLAATWVAYHLEVKEGIVRALRLAIVCSGQAGQRRERLVQRRSRAMNEASSKISTSGGCMLFWRGRMSVDVEQALAESSLDVAIVRRPGELVLTGPAEAIDTFLHKMGPDNPNFIRLQISTPSHSHYLASAATGFRPILQESCLSSPVVPVLAGSDGMRIRSREKAISEISPQRETTIRWDLCMTALKEAGITAVLELGPGNDLAKLIEMEHPGIAARSVDDFRIGVLFLRGS